jgi:homocysteine S-methyltransferase
MLFPSEKNQKSANFLGLNLSEYSKEFDEFVKEVQKITGDVLITSPNDFNGLNEYLKNNF